MFFIFHSGIEVREALPVKENKRPAVFSNPYFAPLMFIKSMDEVFREADVEIAVFQGEENVDEMGLGVSKIRCDGRSIQCRK